LVSTTHRARHRTSALALRQGHGLPFPLPANGFQRDLATDVVGFTSFTEGAPIEVKNKGFLKMYFLDRLKPEFSSGPAGMKMNDKLRQLLHPETR
jgi:hypothetical protein